MIHLWTCFGEKNVPLHNEWGSFVLCSSCPSFVWILLDMYNFLSRRVQIDLEDMHRYAFIDFDQKYTRNLISTDNELYTLLLLCWSPGQASPIHDHPCDGCWMRVVHGQVCESRYKEVKHDSFSSDDDSSSTNWNTTISPLKCTHSETYTQGQVAFINDSIGFHKISNPTSELTMSLHLYCPPFGECRTWLEPHMKASRTTVGYYSAYGHLVSG